MRGLVRDIGLQATQGNKLGVHVFVNAMASFSPCEEQMGVISICSKWYKVCGIRFNTTLRALEMLNSRIVRPVDHRPHSIWIGG